MSGAATETRYRIGEVAELVGTTARTIRYYEEIGLLPAPESHAKGRHRLYTESDVHRLQEIVRLRDGLGVPLDELRSLLEAEEARGRAARALGAHRGRRRPARDPRGGARPRRRAARPAAHAPQGARQARGRARRQAAAAARAAARAQRLTSTTSRPRTAPASSRGAVSSTSLSPISAVISSSRAGSSCSPSAAPGLEAPRHRALDAVDADQRDAAEDERRDRRREVHPAGVAARGDGAAVARAGAARWRASGRRRCRRRRPSAPSAAACPARRARRGRGCRPRRARAGSRPRSAARSRRSPRSRARASRATATLPTPPAAPVTSTGPSPGVDAVALEREHAEHRREAGGADRHRLARVERARAAATTQSARAARRCASPPQWRSPTPKPVTSDRVAGREGRVVGRAHGAGEVDPGDHRERAHDRRAAGDRRARPCS